MRAVIVAGTHSGCGKTTVALGLMAAFQAMGLKVQPFKCGPDFIDAGLHRLITGVPSRNLDIWMCGEDYVRECFYKYSERADISVIEGVMGMYDGQFSTASIAELLNLPVILVADAYGMAESAGALVKGFVEYSATNRHRSRATENVQETSALLHFRTSTLITGVIFNRVASERHYERLKNGVQEVPVLGYLSRDINFEIPHRHLGLTVAEENPVTEKNINKLADAVLKHINVKDIISCSEVKKPETRISKASTDIKSLEMANCQPQFKRVAVAYDKAFCFYYEDNLDMFRNACAEIVHFSPLEDSSLPDGIDAIYLGGGYPELYAERLSKNHSMLKAIYEWSDSGKPLYAECGGLMYLSQGIYYTSLEGLGMGNNGGYYAMAGVFPFETQMRDKLSRLGYREVQLIEDCLLGYKGSILRGHEFHYSEIVKGQVEGTVQDLRTERSGVVESGMSSSARGGIINKIYSIRSSSGELQENEGFLYKNTFASYIHIHFGSNPQTADIFINFIIRSH